MPCDSDDCGCEPIGLQPTRRAFLAAMSAAALMPTLPVMAGPFDSDRADDGPIPRDKKLDADWLRSLTERGEPTAYRGPDQLKYIGMPVGGIGSGTVYLGGDGRLWCWDIFNEHHEGCVPKQTAPPEDPNGRVRERDGANYVKPTDDQSSPWTIDQGFVLTLDGKPRPLDRHGFEDITFKGQYPIATVNYKDAGYPLEVELEAFTPFIPLDTDRSSYPATVMRYTLNNHGKTAIKATLSGYIENCVLNRNRSMPGVQRRLSWAHGEASHTVVGTVEPRPEEENAKPRKDVVFAEFEGKDWGEWVAEGRAFEGGPFHRNQLKPVQPSSGYTGDQFVNTYNTRVAKPNENPDVLTGSLTSPAFTISRKYVNVAIAGGNKPDSAFVEVVVAGKSVGRVTGQGDNALRVQSIDVSAYAGKRAQVRIVDKETGAWGQIAVDQVVLSDRPAGPAGTFDEMPDYGSIALQVTDVDARIGLWDAERQSVVEADGDALVGALSDKQLGGLAVDVELAPGESREITFIVAWHFANTHLGGRKRWYASKFADASVVAAEVGSNVNDLTRLTRLWRDTWYGNLDAAGNDRGTLPHWLLERTLMTVNTLQTNTCYRFDDGQFWAWEGVGCCPGTCTHVWHYAQAVGRLFPELERDLRERTDFGRAFRASDGRINFRGEPNGRDATDGQAGVILRTLREHQVSGDDAFLKRVWPRCKKALEFLVAQDARDGDPDGTPVGEQHNTLDAEWFGKVPVLTSLYMAALRAGQEMASAVGDHAAARRFGGIHKRGTETIMYLFEYDFGFFVQEEDPNHLDAIGIGDGCYIDQVMGQWWAFNLGLGRLYNDKAIRQALNGLWDHNFCPDMGRLRASIENPGLRGRPYAIAGDAGLVMCTWPEGGKRDDWERHWQYGYFNECMTGFEYQAAGHMVWESAWEPELLTKGLAITRSIHDRYHASMRNPFNEIECSDHYARAMSGYGVFLAMSGFEYDGPSRSIGFAPRLTPQRFSSAFTASAGWGTFSQRIENNQLTATLDLAYGALELQHIGLSLNGLAANRPVRRVRVNGVEAKWVAGPDRGVRISTAEVIQLTVGQACDVLIDI